MNKRPVQKIVTRNGATHVQTYWEADQANSKANLALRGQQMRLPGFGASDRVTQRNDEMLKNSWTTHLTRNPKHAEVMHEFIRAGMSSSAADVLTAKLSRDLGHPVTDDEIIDHLYDQEMIDQPAPRGGWIATHSLDQRTHWRESGIPVERAIEWIDSGFPQPWRGIPEMIQSGVSAERAREWQDELRGHQSSWSSDGASLWMYMRELTSDISPSEAAEWRKTISQGSTNLNDRDLEMYRNGFTAAEAGRWVGVIHDDVSMDDVLKLKAQKWTPTSIKNSIAAMRKASRGHGHGRIDSVVARELMTVADRFGVKRAVPWMSCLSEANDFSEESLDKVEAAEALKDRLRTETGMNVIPVLNHRLYSLSPSSQEVLMQMASDGMNMETEWQQRAIITTADFIGSPGKLKLLRDGGYRLTTEGTDNCRTMTDTAYSRPMDLDTATKPEVDRWLRDIASTIYADYGFLVKKWVDDDRVDPAQFKDILERNPSITNTELEATLIHGVNANIADGWL